MTGATRRFGRLAGRREGPQDEAFLGALYRVVRVELAALPVPPDVIDGIARHQRLLRDQDYARRYPDAERWVIEEGGQAVAWVVLAQQDGALRVVDLAVAPGVRRQGIAFTLLRALQEQQREREPAHGTAITLRVRRTNGAALALYAGLGFVPLAAGFQPDAAALELRWG